MRLLVQEMKTIETHGNLLTGRPHREKQKTSCRYLSNFSRKEVVKTRNIPTFSEPVDKTCPIQRIELVNRKKRVIYVKNLPKPKMKGP